jgi:L-seryl-tRNA(Ser) seleniumtransferase
VEIGGGFRIPDIMQESGFQVIEVGTTNRTRLKDYREALKKQKAAICSVHPSNFVIQGFTESVKPEELIDLAKEFDVPLLYDAGSLSYEELTCLKEGFDCITTSTDKTLGATQGGLILARKNLAKALAKNQLYRALRLDKLSIFLLEAALNAYANKTDERLIPLRRMLAVTPSELETRVLPLLSHRFKNFSLEQTFVDVSFGGGSWPGETWQSIGLKLSFKNKNAKVDLIAQMLRTGKTPLLTRIKDGAIQISLQTILTEELPFLVVALNDLDKKLAGTQAKTAKVEKLNDARA